MPEQYLTEDAPVMCPKCQNEMVAIRDPNTQQVARRCSKCSYQEVVPTAPTQGLTPREGGR
jgi:hypothetical protein